MNKYKLVPTNFSWFKLYRKTWYGWKCINPACDSDNTRYDIEYDSNKLHKKKKPIQYFEVLHDGDKAHITEIK